MRRSSSPIRAREWFSGSTTPSGNPGEPGRIILAPGDFFQDWIISPTDCSELYDEPTVLRIIIGDQCHCSVPGGASASISCSLYVGIISVKGDTNTPPLLLPDDGSHDWLYWNQWMMFNGGTNDGFVNAGPTRNGGDTINIKAKRKLPDGSGLALYAFAAVNNSHDVIWAHSDRFLLANR